MYAVYAGSYFYKKDAPGTTYDINEAAKFTPLREVLMFAAEQAKRFNHGFSGADVYVVNQTIPSYPPPPFWALGRKVE